MRKYLLPQNGRFYKANLHCHSYISDGNLSPEELKEAYMKHGYSILAYTDHDVFIPHHEISDDNFLALAGFEMQYHENGIYPNNRDIGNSHFCFIAKSPDMVLHPDWIEENAYIGNCADYRHLVKYETKSPYGSRMRTAECINRSIKKARDAGFFITYNHPSWSLDNYSNYIHYEGMHAMEIFNSECAVLGYDSYSPNIYDDMLRGGKRIFAVSADDNHNKYPFDNPKCASFGGFVMIKADKLEYSVVTDALFAGNFYASQGPEINDLYIEDDKIHVTCSNAQKIVLSTGRRSSQSVFALPGEALNEAEFTFDKEDNYLRITVTDLYGKHANTNAYFVDEFYGGN